MTRPLVSLGLVVYRQEAFVAAAVRGALAQTYRPLEIVISDDASPDRTFAIVEETVAGYRGPHEVVLHRNPSRLGIGNFNSVMERSQGRRMVIAHGDDIPHPHRVEKIVAAFDAHKVSMVCSNADTIDGSGQAMGPWVPPGKRPEYDLDNLVKKGWSPAFLGGSLAWDRELWEVFGPLDPDHSAVSSDWILPFRAGVLGGIHWIAEPLLQWRKHAASKGATYLDAWEDGLVNDESHAANRVIQYWYMLRTLTDLARTGRRTPAQLDRLNTMVIASLGSAAGKFSRARNRLLASGRRARWVQLEPDPAPTPASG